MKSIRRLAVFFLVLLLPCCCRMIREAPLMDADDRAVRAQRLLSAVKTKSGAVEAVKGIGKITFREAGAVRTSRIAWLAARDGRMRIEMMGPAGHAVAKFIFDGKNAVYVSHMDQQTYAYADADPNLGAIIGVPVPLNDLVYFLSGAVPLRDHDGFFLDTEEASGRDVLVLKNWWRGTVQKIYPDMKDQTISQAEFYRWGRLAYRAELGRFRRIADHWIPFSIYVTDGADNGLRIEADNCWIGFPLTPEIFSITPAGG